MIRILLAALFITIGFSNACAQKELWGYKPGENGAIIKTLLNDDNPQPQIVRDFDINGMTGKFPKGRLFQASNGKLYGITSFRSGESEPGAPRGVLFSYDPVTSEYVMLSTTLIDEIDGNLGGLIEPIPGMLYGTTAGGNSIFKFDIANGTASIQGSIPAFSYNSNNYYPRIRGELMKASDGFIYCVTDIAPSVSNVPFPGGIYRFNITTNQFTKLYYFGATPGTVSVIHPEFDTQLIETSPGKLYGTAKGGSHFGPDGLAPLGSGSLFEFTIATNTLTTKYDFDYTVEGIIANPIIKSGNKLYGTLYGQVANFTYPNPDGILYEYDLTLETLTILHSFDFLTDDLIQKPVGRLLAASDGNLYGNSGAGYFGYNPAEDQVNKKMDVYNPYYSNALIEICRKPSYQPFQTASFTICAGSPFSFDLQNVNATSYIWKNEGVIVPSQTSSVLDFESINISDSGTYWCEMTNECGVTITPSITVLVNPANSSTVYSTIPTEQNSIMICPGTTVTLSGNVFDGTWNTGATSPTLLVSEAGEYYITNTNSCGNTYSNIVSVGIYETLAPIIITYEPGTVLCDGGIITFTGNEDGGTWEDGSTGSTYTTTVDTTTAHYVTATNECGTITSNVIQFGPTDLYDVNVMPEIIPDGVPSICAGGSLTLNSNWAQNSAGQWAWYSINPTSYISNSASITITEPGTYVLKRNSYCYGTVASEPVVVTLASQAPPVPVISIDGIPVGFTIFGCTGENLTLQSDGENNVWSSGQTTQSIVVTTQGNYNVTSINGCGQVSSQDVNVIFSPSPITEVTQNANVLTATDTSILEYQWMNCEQNGETVDIPGANDQSYFATQPGSYAVHLINFTGCEMTSECFTVANQDLGLASHNISEGIIVLLPNPATDRIFLRTDLTIENITVTNMLGQSVLKTENTNEIDVSSLPSGYYIAILKIGSGMWRSKFIKK
jgi:hypothetical protein